MAGLIPLGVATLRNLPRGALAGFACVMAALLVTPGIWSGLTTLSAGGNQSDASSWVTAQCVAVQSSGVSGRGAFGGGSLYDCASQG